MNILNDFNKKFKVNDYIIYESDYWIWSLRPDQATIGSGVLSLKREATQLSELNSKEFMDLENIIKVIESTLEKSFNYDIMNYLMLMMVDKHVHYHVVPRYEKNIMFDKKEWIDKGWPALPILQGTMVNDKEAESIINEIKNNIKEE